MIITAMTHFGAPDMVRSMNEKLASTTEAIAINPIASTWIAWSIAHAINRLPIDASAKCNGTRSGVSMIRTSSVESVADIKIRLQSVLSVAGFNANETSLPNLDQE